MPAVRVARGQFITAGQLIVDCCRVAEIIDFNYLDLVSLSPLCLLDRKKKRGKQENNLPIIFLRSWLITQKILIRHFSNYCDETRSMTSVAESGDIETCVQLKSALNDYATGRNEKDLCCIVY